MIKPEPRVGRPFIDPHGVKLTHSNIRLTEAQKDTLRARGGSAYMRLVLDTPQPRAHVVK